MVTSRAWQSRWRPRRRSHSLRRGPRSEEHTSELQSRRDLVCRLLLEKKNGDYNRATALLEESLPLWRETGDKSGLAKSFASLGVVARLQGDFARARALHEQSLALNRELGHKSEVADALLSLGMVAEDEGDYARASALYQECLIPSREIFFWLYIAPRVLHSFPARRSSD